MIEEKRFLDIAKSAFSNQTFSPEKMAMREYLSYAETAKRFEELGVSLDKLDRLYLDYLRAESRCASPMITGSARFPVARNEKYRGWAISKGNALSEYVKKVTTPKVKSNDIRQGDEDAVERQRDKIAALEKEHAELKADPSKREHMYSLAYASKAVKEAKKKLEMLERNKSTVDEKKIIGDIEVVESHADNRIRLFFPGKPDSDMREKLKKNGFRWAPSLGCWQGYINNRSKWFLDELRRVLTPC